MNNIQAITADEIFTGYEMLQGYVLLLENNVVRDIITKKQTSQTDVKDYGNAIIAPALIDLQLYGASGRLLSALPDAATVKAIAEYSKKGGTCLCMPTVATQTYPVIFKCIDAIKTYWQQGGTNVIGLHVEGPWISKEKRGAHNPDWIFSPSIEEAKQLLEYGKDVIRMITIAPEVCSDAVIVLIKSYNIIISAGHSNATYEEATAAFSKGIHTATHLYNAMSALQHRSAGMVGAVLNHPSVTCSLVPDGHHVSWPAIQIAKKIMDNRLFAITDAVAATNEGYYQHAESNDMYTSNGILSGSALTMHKAFFRLVRNGSIDVEEALRMCSLYPAQVMQLDNYGVIEKSKPFNAIVLNEELELMEVIG